MNRKLSNITFVASLFVLALASVAFACITGSFSYEKVLTQFSDSISGPVAVSVCIIGLAAGGFAMIFGGDLQGWLKTLLFCVFIIGCIAGAAAIVQKLGLTGASIIVSSALNKITTLA